MTCDDGNAADAFIRELQKETRFTVVARYRDLNGDQLVRTHATLAHNQSLGWSFEEVKLYNGEEPEPFATLPGRSTTVALLPALER